jgi:3',5'-cyclic AMP phosphodiesterase CpdA
MFRLAHISDPHLGPMPPVTWRELASKRITGYVNWQRHRGKMMGAPVLVRLMEEIASRKPDHLAITGDLVNLGLEAELSGAQAWLKELGDPADVSVVPGNHDAYVPGSLERACRLWSANMTGDGLASADAGRASFPYLRVRGRIALIGVSSAIATAPFMARGAFRPPQAGRLAAMLGFCGGRGLFRTVMIHHPPVRGAASLHKRLFGIGLFQRVIRDSGAELILHGHTHKPTGYLIDGKDSAVPVIGVSSASQSPGGHAPAASFNMFDISGGQGRWSCALTRTVMTGDGVNTARESRAILMEDGRAASAGKLGNAVP